MKALVIPVIDGALGTVPQKKRVKIKIRGRIETIQTTWLLKSTWILLRVLQIWRDLLSFRLHWTSTRWSWCNNWPGLIIKKKNNNDNNYVSESLRLYRYEQEISFRVKARKNKPKFFWYTSRSWRPEFNPRLSHTKDF